MNAPIVFALAVALSLCACGKKGNPLPPIVRLPVAPVDFAAKRRAMRVDLQFMVPAANTDGTRPANIMRVDIYALTGPPIVSNVDVLRDGARIARVDVKAPRDPNAVIGPGDPDADLEPLEGPGLDQGTTARVTEDLSALPPATSDSLVRHYVAVPVSIRGRNGLLSTRVTVPLTPAPRAPSTPDVTYDERSVTLTWMPVPAASASNESIAYHVYEMARTPPPAAGGADTAETQLTTTPVSDTRFVDDRIEWGVERCYVARSAAARDGFTVESDPSAPACVTLTDTFPPAAPAGLIPAASEGTITLTWDPNTEKDFAGYLVLRGVAPGAPVAIAPAPIEETTFKDSVPAGVRYVYAVQAVDRAGNISAPSTQVESAAR